MCPILSSIVLKKDMRTLPSWSLEHNRRKPIGKLTNKKDIIENYKCCKEK